MTRRNRIAVGVAIAALGVLAGSAVADVEQVRLKIDGMSCPFCIHNMEKRVKKIEGVEPKGIESILKTGITTIPWKGGQSFSPASLRQAVADSGFTLRTIDVVVKGVARMERVGDVHVLKIVDPGTKQAFLLAPDARADRRQVWDSLMARSKGSESARLVRVQGRVEPDAKGGSDGSWHLVLTGWAPVQFGAQVDLEVQGFVCENCSTGTMQGLEDLDGVIHAQANHQTGRVLVWTASASPDTDALRTKIEALGFTVTHAHVDRSDEHADVWIN